MALKAILTQEAFDALDEAVRALYSKQGESYVLDLDGIDDHPGVGELKRAHERAKEATTEAKALAEKLAEDIKKFEGIDPEKARVAADELQKLEDKKLLDDGQVEEVIAQRTERMRTDLQKQIDVGTEALAAKNVENMALQGTLEEVQIHTAIRDAATVAGVQDGAIDDIISRAKPIWGLVDGAPYPKDLAKGDDGKVPLYGKSGAVMTIAEWVEALGESAPHLFNPSKGAGAPGGGGGEPPKGGVKILDGNAENVVGENLAAIADGSAEVRY